MQEEIPESPLNSVSPAAQKLNQRLIDENPALYDLLLSEGATGSGRYGLMVQKHDIAMI